jgi:hypothetical protein
MTTFDAELEAWYARNAGALAECQDPDCACHEEDDDEDMAPGNSGPVTVTMPAY